MCPVVVNVGELDDHRSPAVVASGGGGDHQVDIAILRAPEFHQARFHPVGGSPRPLAAAGGQGRWRGAALDASR